MTLKRLNEVAICFATSWWRPLSYFIFIGAIFVNTIVIPYVNKTTVSLLELSTLLLGFAPLAGLRTYEKIKDPNDPMGTVVKPTDTE